MKAGKLISLPNKIPRPEKRIFWITFLIIIKFSLLLFLILQNRPTTLTHSIAVCSGDCDSYLDPIDNLLDHGQYAPENRMPGYGFPYMIFRALFVKNTAASLMIILQTLLDAIAAFVLALTLYFILKKRTAFYFTILFYGLGVTISCYNNWILTESLTSSVLIFGFYFFVSHLKSKKYKDLILSGLFFTWAYFLRPVNIPLLLFPAILLLFNKSQFRFRNLICFLLPAILFQSMWTVRNYYLKNKFILLTENPYLSMYKTATIETWNFCKTFSDFKVTNSFFEPVGLSYFGQAVQTIKIEDIHIPDEIYTEDFNLDSLLVLRKNFEEINSTDTERNRKAELTDTVIRKLRFYTSSIRKHHPFLVYVKTPLVLLKGFVVQSGVHNLFFYPFSYLQIHQKIFKLFFIGIYWIVFIFFICGLVLYPKQILNNKSLLLSYAIAFYLIFIHSVFLRSIELRYLIPAYPFFVIGSVYCLNRLKNSLQIKLSPND